MRPAPLICMPVRRFGVVVSARLRTDAVHTSLNRRKLGNPKNAYVLNYKYITSLLKHAYLDEIIQTGCKLLLKIVFYTLIINANNC